MNSEKQTFYRKASSLYSVFENHTRCQPFIFGKNWSITEKIDGTQVGIEINLNNLNTNDSTYTFTMRTHGGNLCFDDSLDMTIEKLTTGKFSYQKVSMSTIFPEIIDSCVKLMKEMDLTKSYFYFEVTLNGKTPCKLSYTDDRKSRAWLFNHVYIDKNDLHINVSITQDTFPLFSKHKIPCVPFLLSGDSFDSSDFKNILEWCDSHPDSEGVVFHQPEGNLIKIKTHHSMSLIKTKPLFGSKVLSDIYDEYIKSLDSSSMIKTKRDKVSDKTTKRNELTDAQINDEISKEFTHETHSELLTQYLAEDTLINKQQILGSSNLRKAVDLSLTSIYGEEKAKKNKKKILKLVGAYLQNQLT